MKNSKNSMNSINLLKFVFLSFFSMFIRNSFCSQKPSFVENKYASLNKEGKGNFNQNLINNHNILDIPSLPLIVVKKNIINGVINSNNYNSGCISLNSECIYYQNVNENDNENPIIIRLL